MSAPPGTAPGQPPQSNLARKLENLNLADNQAGDEGTASLAGVLHQTHLTLLDLSRNTVGDAGAASLSLSLAMQPSPRLTELRLNGNCITAAGAKRLNDALTANSSMLTLDLSDNPAVSAAPELLSSIAGTLERNWCRRALYPLLRAQRNLAWARGSHGSPGSACSNLPADLMEMVSDQLQLMQPPVAKAHLGADAKPRPPAVPPRGYYSLLDRYALQCGGTPLVWAPLGDPKKQQEQQEQGKKEKRSKETEQKEGLTRLTARAYAWVRGGSAKSAFAARLVVALLVAALAWYFQAYWVAHQLQQEDADAGVDVADAAADSAQ